jgi:hypothetical protein
MLVVAIVGILSSIAIPAFSRYVKKSRTAEAVGHIEKLWVGSVAYYEADHADSGTALLPKLFPGSNAIAWENTNCCTYPNQRCPANPVIYDQPPSLSVPWKALGFSIPMEHYYRPQYNSWTPGSWPTYDMWIKVFGDLDCDNITSEFGLQGKIVDQAPQRVGIMYTVNELE